MECEICVDRLCLEHVSDEAECSRKVAGAIRSLVNVRSLQLECARVLHESLLVPVLMYGSETMIWREEVRSRIRVGCTDGQPQRSAGCQENG